MMLFIVAVLSILLPSISFAACSGSGLTWTCTAGSTQANVNSAISSATDGATITFASGSYTWSSSAITPSISKGVTLICESEGACTVSSSGVAIGMPTGSSSKLYRISGFTFNHTADGVIWTCPGGSCSATTITQLRIDHNTFNPSGAETIMYVGEGSSADNYFYGVVDHNTVNCSVSCYFAQLYNGTSNNATTGALGSANNLFFEDNTITITTIDNDGTGCVDGWGGHGIVWRFNTATNCRVLMHGVTHGWGPRNFEVYHNTITHNAGSSALLEDGYRSIHHQGSGTYMIFENVITPVGTINTDSIVVLHYRSAIAGSGSNRCDGTVGVDGNRSPTGTYYGYPCKRQPGRDVDASLHPMFAFKNRTNGGTKIDLVCNDYSSEVNPNTCVHHVVENRDYYNAVSANAQSSASSPFNGTTGMGFGTLANRPTTCTTNSESADAGNGGVGYWATDEGDWRTDNGSTKDGQLYMCTETNTWTLKYTPYTYPHPLVGGGGASTGGSMDVRNRDNDALLVSGR